MNRIVACLIAVVFVAGCGGAPTRSTALRSKESSPSTSLSPASITIAPPKTPRKAKQNSTTGAVSFAAYYLDVRNYALQTGDTTELKRITAPQCLMCLQAPTLIESVYRGGGHIEGGLWVRTTDVFPPSNYPGGQPPKGMNFLDLSIHLMPVRVISPEGKITAAYEGSQHDRGLTITIRWDHGGWLVDGIMTVGGQQL